jgi:hypothetical protein
MVLHCGPHRSIHFLQLHISGFFTQKFNLDILQGREVFHAEIKVATGDPHGWEGEAEEFSPQHRSLWKYRWHRRDTDEAALVAQGNASGVTTDISTTCLREKAVLRTIEIKRRAGNIPRRRIASGCTSSTHISR